VRDPAGRDLRELS